MFVEDIFDSIHEAVTTAAEEIADTVLPPYGECDDEDEEED